MDLDTGKRLQASLDVSPELKDTVVIGDYFTGRDKVLNRDELGRVKPELVISHMFKAARSFNEIVQQG